MQIKISILTKKSLNKRGSDFVLRCFSVSAVSLQPSRKWVIFSAQEKSTSYKRTRPWPWRHLRYTRLFLFFFFQIVTLAQVSASDCCVVAPLQPDDLIFLRINLCVDSFTIKELNLRWKSEAGMVENIESIVEEYRNTRQLLVTLSRPFINTLQQLMSTSALISHFFLYQNWQMLHLHLTFFIHNLIVSYQCPLHCFSLYSSL